MTWLPRRLAWTLVTVWAVVSVAFALNALLPGDPARMFAGPQARPADVARIRTQLGLDRPPIVQYALFWRRLVHVGLRAIDSPSARAEHRSCSVVFAAGERALHVDLGESFQLGQPVARTLATRLPRTFALTAAGLAFQLLLGGGAGVLAAATRGSWLDRWLVGTSVLGVSAPTFLTAILLQRLFAYDWRLLPLDGFGTTWAEHARCLVLPAVTLGIYGAAYYTRLVRDEVSVVIRQDWVRTARAKGLGPSRVLVRHAVRNSLVPVATAVGLDFGALMGGAVVTETVFRWPGLGDLGVKAATGRDGPLLIGCVVVTSIVVVGANLLVDVLCGRLDPRVRG